MRRASSVSSTLRRTVVSNELSAPPPLIAPKGKDGKPKKIEFGGWMVDYGFPVLARMKGLRGTRFDPFGRSEERRTERRLIAEYEELAVLPSRCAAMPRMGTRGVDRTGSPQNA